MGSEMGAIASSLRPAVGVRRLVDDIGQPGAVVQNARQRALQHLPEDKHVFLLPSRHCESELVGDMAWSMSGGAPDRWSQR